MSVFAPEYHIGALTDENITEGRMSAVGRAGQHHEIAVYFSGEQYGVTVKRKERILDSGKRLEILGFRNTDGCAVEILTLDDVWIEDNLIGAKMYTIFKLGISSQSTAFLL